MVKAVHALNVNVWVFENKSSDLCKAGHEVDSQGMHESNMFNIWMHEIKNLKCNASLLWRKASAKCMNVNTVYSY